MARSKIHEILEAIKGTDRYTLHSHTQYCDGKASMDEFAREAVAQHFDVYGFTPHSPTPFYSSCNMAADDVPRYLAEFNRIVEAYPQVRFYAGMEIDYIGPEWGPASEQFRILPLDYTIGSVHFIPSQDGDMVDIDGRYPSFEKKMHEHFHDDIRYVAETFFSQSQRMVAEGCFDIIGHFDKIKHNGSLFSPGLEEQPWFAKLVDDLIDSIIAAGVVVEVNTKAWREHQQLFPAQRHWRRLLQAGVPMVVNSDAHHPTLIDASRREVLASLRYLQGQMLQHR